MNIFRSFIAALLAASLFLASTASLNARIQAIGSSTFTICSGQVTKTITVDRNGAPQAAAHLCLDCCLSLQDHAGFDLTFAPIGFGVNSGASLESLTILDQKPSGIPRGRGPPTRV